MTTTPTTFDAAAVASLRAAAQRALESLDSLIADHQDPGAEALGARYELARALSNTSPEIARQLFGRVTAEVEGCTVLGSAEKPDEEREQHEALDPTTADDPVPLRWGLNDILYGDATTTTICLSGPKREPYWLELTPNQNAVLRDALAGPVGQQTASRVELAQQRTLNRSGVLDTADTQIAALTDDEPAEADLHQQ
jgi:hypothetical protein